MQTSCYYVKRAGFSVPIILGLYKIRWITRTRSPIMLGCPPPLIASTTGHYNSTLQHLVSLSRQSTARENSRMCPRRTQQHQYALPYLLETYQKHPNHGCLYILHRKNTQKQIPSYSTVLFR